MIRLIETLNFRCLRHVRQQLGPFHVLVGPNASGKTTFLDVITFLGRMVSDGIDAATEERTENFLDLVWWRKGESFELAVEATIPGELKTHLKKKEFDTIRYEVRIGVLEGRGDIGIMEERAILKQWKKPAQAFFEFFPREINAPSTILEEKARSGSRTVLGKSQKGNDNYYSEVVEAAGKGWYPSISHGRKKSALQSLDDEKRFPVSTWFRTLLVQGVQSIVLNSLLIRKPSPWSKIYGFKPDGSNLPWVIEEVRKKAPNRFKDWIRHIRSALPDIEDIKTVERPEDRHRYLKILYKGGLEVPSWMASDGTLRLLALTIPAYIPELKGVYLIEEPENGVHPGAVETLYQSLSSVYDAQILMATHSTVILSLAEVDKVLCFKKTVSGATDIVRGRDHPALRNWKGQPNLSVLFGSGVLG